MKLAIFIITIFLMSSISVEASDPYSFYPSSIYRMDEAVFDKEQPLVSISPTRPLVVRDKEGNVMITSSDGKVMVKVETSGRKTYSIGGRRDHQRSADGDLEKRWVRQEGSNIERVENERGEIIGYEEYAMGGKLIASYDEEMNMVSSIQYDQYGKRIKSVTDEMTMTKIIYDERGRADKEIDHEGYEIGWYEYDKSGRLVSKEDIYGNVTKFDSNGNMTKTYDREGKLLNTYNYRKSDEGFVVLESVKNEESGVVTLYENGRQVKSVDPAGNTVQTYKWLGTRLIYSENVDSGEITWFQNGRPMHTTYKGEVASEWFYERGRLVGMWDVKTQRLTMYSYGREGNALLISRKPEKEEVLDLRNQFRIAEH